MVQQTGDFGTIYEQFEGKPKEAIKHLLKVKQGECVKAHEVNHGLFILEKRQDCTHCRFL